MKNYIQYGAIAVLIIIIIFCFSRSAQADSVNVSYLNTSYNYSAPASFFLDDSANGFSITYGLDITPNWSLDIAYADLGEASNNSFGIPVTFKAETFSLAAHHAMAIGAISGHTIKWHALAGVAKARAKAQAGLNSLSDNDVGFMAGTGLSIWLSATSAITALYIKRDLVFDSGGVAFDYDPETLELGYTYRF